MSRKQREQEPVCCSKCFDDEKVAAFIKDHGRTGSCSYCGAKRVPVLDPTMLSDVLQPFFDGYVELEPGEHYIPQLEDATDVGQTIEELVEEDALFSDRLGENERAALLEALFDGLNRRYDFDSPRYRVGSGDLWTRSGKELWADEDAFFFRAPSRSWTQFTKEIRHRNRFIRSEVGPAKHLTQDLLEALSEQMKAREPLFRAVLGGKSGESGRLQPHEWTRMAGPLPEHCRQGGRVNPPGIPMLYGARDTNTAISEVRPFKGAPVSVATMKAKRDLRIINFSAAKAPPGTSNEVADLLEAIAQEMARPVDPNASEIEYVPTQYVAELVRAAGYDGVAYKSALGPGTNIVLFDREDAEVVIVELHRVDNVTYAVTQHPDTIDDEDY